MRAEESRRILWLALASALVVAVAALYWSRPRRAAVEPAMPPPEAARPEVVDPWKEAAVKVEEDRGEPTGRQADIDIPSQLKHGEDRRRFLGVQVAEWRKHRFERPHDFAELVALIRDGQLVEAPALGADFILYGVGYSADDEPFTHYDAAADRSVTLFAGEAELRQEYEQLAESGEQLTEVIEGLKKEAAGLPRAERARRKEIDEQIKDERKSLDTLRKRKRLLDDFYKKPEQRALMFAEYEALSSLARDFGGETYDLQDAASRKRFKARLLSFVRPAALGMLEAVARAYREKFDRHLPVTSLVRTDEYQRQLNETNPNATLIDVPPHTTGLAFDIFYRHMTAAEQEFVMAELARLSDEGRVEALRERRDHYHVFAFAEGRRPDEALIAETLGRKPAAQKQEDDDDKKQRAAQEKKPAKKTRETSRAAAPKRGRAAEQARAPRPKRAAERLKPTAKSRTARRRN
ncbi:MAG TPA: DUF5715 family protein [Pyrinomonadaceae bacterium]|nr:DUF5715 family protein [Pyrinomonadaceae bacterium]